MEPPALVTGRSNRRRAGSQDAVLNLFDEVAVRIVAASSKDTRKDTDEKKSPSRFSLLEVDDD